MKFLFSTLLLCILGSGVSCAAILKSITIDGLRRVDQNAVLARINLAPGQDVKESDLSAAVKSLYSTQYFYKISMNIEDGVLKVVVVENPIVNDVLFGGITKKYADQIKEEMQLKPRGVYTRDKAKFDSERIRVIFHKMGRLNVSVVPKIEVLDRNRVNVLFDVDDGDTSRVDSVVFMGTKFFSNAKLFGMISQRPASSPFKIFRGKIFEEDALDVDSASIVQSYMDSGFPYAAINYVIAEYERVTRNFAITYDISEGDRYRIDSVSIVSEVPNLSIADLEEKVVRVRPGDFFSQRQIENTVAGITEYLHNIGYAFEKIEPVIEHNDELKTTDIRFVIKDAGLVYIGRINILGTRRTNDPVVRSELLVKEGDLYNRRLIQKSKIQLQVLHYFDLVEIKEKRGEDSNTIDLDIILRDLKQTGSISFSIGYSTFESIILNLGVSKNNIAGWGYNGSFSTILSLWRRTVSIGFSKPHFLGTNLNFGFDVTYNNIYPVTGGNLLPLITSSLFTQDSVTASIRLGYPITARLFHSWSFQYRYDSLGFQNISSATSTSIYRDQVTQQQMSTGISHTLSYDHRDNGLLPSKGFFASLTQTLGLPMPHQLHYESNDLMAGLYVPLSRDKSWVLSLILKGGAIIDYNGGNVPFQYRYSLGYYNMRGFYFSGVGPHAVTATLDSNGTVTDVNSGGTIGLRGNYYYVASLELRIPTPLPKEYGLNLVAFMDIGSSFGITGVPTSVDESLSSGQYVTHNSNGTTNVEYVIDSAMPRIAVGGGLLYMSPMGPIRIEFAAAVLKQDFDVPLVVRIHFSGSPI